MVAKRKGGRGAKGRRAHPSTSWVLGRRSAPFLVEKPERHRAELLVLIDVGASRMVALEAVSPGQTAEAVAEWAGPRVESGVTLRVESEELASALRARLGARADVFVAETPEVDEAIDALGEFTDRERAEPWRWASDGHVLAFDAPALGWPGAIAAVMGNAGSRSTWTTRAAWPEARSSRRRRGRTASWRGRAAESPSS